MFNRIREERGFSLIELAVVVGIIGILAAIAIPTFLGQRAGAQDRQAHTSLRNTMTLARAAAANTDSGNYPEAVDLLPQLIDGEPAYSFEDASAASDPSTGPNSISVKRLSDESVALAAESESGMCWVVLANIGAASAYGKYEVADGPACDAFLVVADDDDDLATTFSPADFVGTSFGTAQEMDIAADNSGE